MSSCTCARLRTLNYSRHSTRSTNRHNARTAKQVVKRYASSAVVLKSRRNIVSQPSVPEVLTALHKTSAFLPRILPRRQNASQEVQSVDFWDDLLDVARESLSPAASDRVARVVVCGYEENSGAEDLVSALLQEPFASETTTQSIQNRWRQSQTGLIIRSDPSTSDPISKPFLLQSSWLQQFQLPIELHEISSSRRDIGNQYSISPTLRIISVNPTEALQGLDAFRSNPGSPIAVQRYQDSFTKSGVPDITSSIGQSLSFPDSDAFKSLRTQTATYILRASLSACQAELHEVEKEVNQTHSRISQLRSRVTALQGTIHAEAFGSSDGQVVQDAVTRAKQVVRPTMDRLTWWRLLWKVDDVAEIVTSSVNRAWCRHLEDQLIFLAGRLSCTQDELAKTGKRVLSDSPQTSYFRSPVLYNTVDQLERSPKYRLKYDVLTGPIYTRRNQLLHPTNMLHSTAQRVTIGMGGSVISGFGIAWAGWAGQLGLLGVYGQGMETESVVGLGLLTASLGVRWAVGRWERAKKRWWKDWDRVGQGLERDLKTSLDKTLQNQVAIIPNTVCEGMDKLVLQRKGEITTLAQELAVLDGDTRWIVSSQS